MKNSRLFWAITTLTLVISGAAIISLAFMDRSEFSEQVRDDFVATLLAPEDEDFKVDKASVKLTKIEGEQVLNYEVEAFDTKLTVGEQATPQTFLDIPQYYPKVVDQSKPYGTIGVNYGTVYLTRPDGKQLAMLNARGTYMLVRAEKDLTDDQWRQFFKSLVVVK